MNATTNLPTLYPSDRGFDARRTAQRTAQPVNLPTTHSVNIVRPRTLTTMICDGTTLEERQTALMRGWNHDAASVHSAKEAIASMRHRYGFKRCAVPLLTAPDANMKLSKGKRPAYGLTLQSHITRMSDGIRVNACPSAGQCIRVCVLNNGSGRYASVQRARDYRTELFATDPLSALVLIGHELERAVRKAHSKRGPNRGITFRPNVNSDLDWSAIVGPLLRNLPSVASYGYSKRPASIGSGALTAESYSAGERTTADILARCDARQIPIAVVTNRAPKSPITQWHPTRRVVDADLSDEWIFDGAVIGDLSAKGIARQLIRPTDERDVLEILANRSFVKSVY